jgi:hypothetical protein
MPTHVVSQSIQMDAGTLTKTTSYTIDAELSVDEPTTQANNVQKYISFPTQGGRLKSLFIVCDKAVTLYTNDASSGSPDDTITLSADIPVVWHSSSGFTSPVSNADVASIYVSQAGAGTGTLQIRAGFNV